MNNLTSKIARVIATACLLSVPCLASNKGSDLTTEKFHVQKTKFEKAIKASKKDWLSSKLSTSAKPEEEMKVQGKAFPKTLFVKVGANKLSEK